MLALIEVNKDRAEIVMSGETDEVVNELKKRYNREVREAKIVNWDVTVYRENRYAKFSDYDKRVEWFVTKMGA